MAQLSDDCFATADDLVTIEAALARFRDTIAPVPEIETVALADAFGRILAEDVTAAVPLPPFYNSAVDGYAVRHGDVAAHSETRLEVVDRLQAGEEALREIGAGEAARVFTGAPMPAGADTIYMQEDCRAVDGAVIVPPGLKRGANARPAGEELHRGDRALKSGRRLTAQDVSLAASIGRTHLKVRRPLRVALFSTGDELVAPGQPLPAAKIYDSNRIMLIGLCRRLGIEVSDLGVLRDDLVRVRAALGEAAPSHDLIVTTGGVSTGEADYVKDAVAAIGRLDIWRFAIKPGRPLAIGALDGAAFVGLPGNPVAVYVTFTQVVRGLVAALAGETFDRPMPRPVRADFAYKKKRRRTEFVRVSLAPGSDGIPLARRFTPEGAGILTSLTRTDGLVELQEDATGVAPGDLLAFRAFDEIA